MKTKLFSTLIFVIFTNALFAQETFVKIFSDNPINGMAELHDLKQTSDSGYIITGLNFDSSYGPFLIKLNNGGDTIWTKHYVNVSAGLFVFATCDGGFMSVGVTDAMKTDMNGNTIISKTYSDISITSACKTNDCGYILAGNTQNFGAGGNDFFILKIDSLGGVLWGKTYGGSREDIVTSVEQTSDNGLIISGYSNSFDSTFEAYVIKTDELGDTIWTRSFNLLNCQGTKAIETFDNSYVLLASSDSGAILMKCDTIGNLIWSKSYGDFKTIGYSIHQTNDGGFIFTISSSLVINPTKAIYIKSDSNGNKLWNYEFSLQNERNYSPYISETNDGGYILAVCGIAHLNTASSYSIIKTTNIGRLNCGDLTSPLIVSIPNIIVSSPSSIISTHTTTESSLTTNQYGMSISIQTFCSTVDISEQRSANHHIITSNIISKNNSIDLINSENYKNAMISIFDIQGHPIFTDIMTGSGQNILLSIRQRLSPGIYFIRILQNNSIEVVKIVIV